MPIFICLHAHITTLDKEIYPERDILQLKNELETLFLNNLKHSFGISVLQYLIGHHICQYQYTCDDNKRIEMKQFKLDPFE